MNDELKKGFIKVPFTPYDIFGYLIPGASFFIGAYLFDFLISESIKNSDFLPIYTIFHKSVLNLGNNFVVGTIYIIMLIISAYVLGHIIASVSSHFLDRLLIEKGHGYPLQQLLKLNQETIRKGRISAFIRGAFFWVNVYLVIQYLGFVFNIKLFTVLADFIINIFIIYSSISLVFLIIYKWNPEVDPNRVNWNFLNFIKIMYNYSLKYFFAGPYDLFSYLYSILIRTRETFDDIFIDKYKNYFNANFNYDAEEAGTNNYWLSFLFVSEKSALSSSLINNWLFLYSFARNISTSLLMLFIYAFISLISQIDLTSMHGYIFLLPLFYFAAYLIMLTRYYYLFKNYYTKFIIRSFVFLNEIRNG